MFFHETSDSPIPGHQNFNLRQFMRKNSFFIPQNNAQSSNHEELQMTCKKGKVVVMLRRLCGWIRFRNDGFA